MHHPTIQGASVMNTINDKQRTYHSHGDKPILTMQWRYEDNGYGWRYVRNSQTFYKVSGQKYHEPKWQPFMNILRVGECYAFATKHIPGYNRSQANFIPTEHLLTFKTRDQAEKYQSLVYNNYIRPNEGNVQALNDAFDEVINICKKTNHSPEETINILNYTP